MLQTIVGALVILDTWVVLCYIGNSIDDGTHYSLGRPLNCGFLSWWYAGLGFTFIISCVGMCCLLYGLGWLAYNIGSLILGG